MCTNWNHRYSQEEEDDSKNGDEDGEIELKTGRRRFSTLYRKSDLAFPEMKVHCLVPNIYIHVSVSDLYIPRIGLPIFGWSKIGGTILVIYKSLKDTWMWKFYFGNIEAAQFHFWEYTPLQWKSEISWILLMCGRNCYVQYIHHVCSAKFGKTYKLWFLKVMANYETCIITYSHDLVEEVKTSLNVVFAYRKRCVCFKVNRCHWGDGSMLYQRTPCTKLPVTRYRC